jgi:predicted metalloprotease
MKFQMDKFKNKLIETASKGRWYTEDMSVDMMAIKKKVRAFEYADRLTCMLRYYGESTERPWFFAIACWDTV